MRIGKRIEPEDDVELKLGDIVTYEIIYDDGQTGTITTIVSKIDLLPALIDWLFAWISH